MRRRAALEAVIGHLKAEHRMGRNHLKERHSDGINAIPAAAGSTSVRSWGWLAAVLRPFIRTLLATPWRPETS
jgi:IS5 family transposase